MIKTRVFLYGAVAAIFAFGICGQQELKAQDAVGPVGHVVRVGQVDVIPEDGFDPGAGLYQGPVIVGRIRQAPAHCRPGPAAAAEATPRVPAYRPAALSYRFRFKLSRQKAAARSSGRLRPLALLEQPTSK